MQALNCRLSSRALVLLACSWSIATMPLSALAQEFTTEQEDTDAVLAPKDFYPYAGRNSPVRVFWGDTHLHTMVSVDAGTMNRLTQEDAYRFARGEEVRTTHGLRAKLSRPLDFLVISDHGEMYGGRVARLVEIG